MKSGPVLLLFVGSEAVKRGYFLIGHGRGVRRSRSDGKQDARSDLLGEEAFEDAHVGDAVCVKGW